MFKHYHSNNSYQNVGCLCLRLLKIYTVYLSSFAQKLWEALVYIISLEAGLKL